jgi:hypothetical protein
MATNRDLLKEAIADAKAVKEMAIANAKATLEETFAPHLKNALSAKLQEMEELEEDDYVTELDLEEKEEEGMMKDVDLNELFGELNEEEAEEESEEPEEEESEDENLPDLTDMSPEEQDEYLKDIIEKVLSDMMESGEVKLSGDEMGAEEESEEEEINLDELLAEIESLEEDEEELDEIFGLFGKKGGRNYKTVISQLLSDNDDLVKAIAAESDLAKRKQMAEPLLKKAFAEFGKLQNEEPSEKVIDNMSEFKREIFGDPRSLLQKLASGSSAQVAAREGIEEELAEAYSTIETLRKELNEVNLLNAKLLYTNKIFKAKTLTESQKLNVLSMFDKAKNVGEVKLVFETLSEGLKTKSTPIKENLGSASKIMGTTTPKQPIVESNDMVARFQKLAGII